MLYEVSTNSRVIKERNWFNRILMKWKIELRVRCAMERMNIVVKLCFYMEN